MSIEPHARMSLPPAGAHVKARRLPAVSGHRLLLGRGSCVRFRCVRVCRPAQPCAQSRDPNCRRDLLLLEYVLVASKHLQSAFAVNVESNSPYIFPLPFRM